MTLQWQGNAPRVHTRNDSEGLKSQKNQRIDRLKEVSAQVHWPHWTVCLLQVFVEFDLDGSGQIDCAELLQLGRARRILGHKV